jgi:hypothetical protein
MQEAGGVVYALGTDVVSDERRGKRRPYQSPPSLGCEDFFLGAARKQLPHFFGILLWQIAINNNLYVSE